MICSHLCRITSAAALAAGARAINEPYVRPDCQLSPKELELIHEGKDESINDSLSGGNGFPFYKPFDLVAANIFQMGVTEERRDLRSVLAWQADLSLCLADRKKGATA